MMQLLKFKKLQNQLILSIAIMLTCFSILKIAVEFPGIYDSLWNGKKQKVKNLVQSQMSVLEHYHGLAERGEISISEAKNRAKEAMEKARYGEREKGYFFIIDEKSTTIMNPVAPRLNGQDASDLKDEKGKYFIKHMAKVARDKNAGFVKYHWQYYDNKNRVEPKVSYVQKFESWGWILGTGVYTNDVSAAIWSVFYKTVLTTIGVMILFVIVIIFISRNITKPIRQLSASTQEISRGNLDAKLPDIKSGDEVGQLYSSFNNMRHALKEYITNLTETTKAKERIESELHIAQTIQMSFLPKRFPPFPDRNEFELYATLVSAKEIGGDLYDYFFLDEENLFISIGDVSDKGVPAALFMAATKTLIKGVAETMNDPSKIMEKVNFELCQDNDSSMFVTYFSGILNIRTGTLRYSNAGHNPPLLVRKDSTPTWLELPPGLVLGAMEDSQYKDLKITLQSGDSLLLYTDGVTEATNKRQEIYSNQRLLDKTRELQTNNPEHIVNQIMDSIREFSRGTDQSDDITLLFLTYRGSP